MGGARTKTGAAKLPHPFWCLERFAKGLTLLQTAHVSNSASQLLVLADMLKCSNAESLQGGSTSLQAAVGWCFAAAHARLAFSCVIPAKAGIHE
jgi:hypothetical protein